jgi:fructokinase
MPSSPDSPALAVGELLWDLLPSGPRLGGATTNFAVLVARLGAYVSLVSRLGDDDLGRQAMERLQVLAADSAGRLNLGGLQVSPTLPTGTVSIALNAAGVPRYEIHEPAAWDAIEPSEAVMALAAKACVLYFGTLAQRQVGTRATIAGLVGAAPAGCLRVADLNLRAPFVSEGVVRWCLAHADVLKVSDEELPQLGRLLDDRQVSMGFPAAAGGQAETLTVAAAGAARRLLTIAPNCKLVAITLGASGSLLANRRERYRHPGIPVKVVDTIGAGDAFTAGLMHSYLRGATLGPMSQVANLCGSFVASQPGATPVLSAELMRAIAEVLG